MKRLAPLLFISFAVLPLGAGLVYALLYSLGLAGALQHGFTLAIWRQTLSDHNLWMSLGLSALMAFFSILIAASLALALLVWLRPQLERPGMRFLLHFPLALPPIVAAFVSFQWLGSSGMLSRGMYAAGLINSQEGFPVLINDPLYAGVGITLTLSTFPFFLLVFLHQYKAAQLLAISDLAATLGATAAQINRRVVAPVLLRRARPTLLLYGVFLFGAFEVPLLLGRQNPAMISMFIHHKFSRFNLADLPVAYAATVVYALLLMLFTVFFLRKSRENAW
jgi:putative spermidine/putrescine transport system permease protein